MGLFSKKVKDEKEVESTNKVKVKKVDQIEPVEKTEELTIEQITNAKTKKQSKEAKTTVAKKDTGNAYKVLVRPLITEKASHLKSENKYLFEVSQDATKNEIKKAIFHVYGYWPTKINIINLRGKHVRYGRHSGITNAKKKALITLKKDETIEIYEGV